MMKGDPKKRITASKAMDHPWVKFEGESFSPEVQHNHWLNYSLRKRTPIFLDFEEDVILAELTNAMTRQTFEPGSQVEVGAQIQ